MANGYIGKISAVVTANTSDLSRKLAEGRDSVDKFARGLELSLRSASASATASVDKIFTAYQRLERKFQTALALNIRTEDQVRALRQTVSVVEQINKPLAAAASSFEQLTLETQAAFLPALKQAQAAAVGLSNTLASGGDITQQEFARAEQAVTRVTQAIGRLTQAQQLASQGFSGSELQFTNPRLFAAINSASRASQDAAALPADRLADGDIARQVRALQQYKNAAVEAEATVARLRLEPNVNPDIVLAAERRLDQLTETARRSAEAVREAVASANDQAARISAANAMLPPVLQGESDLLSREGQSTRLPYDPRQQLLRTLSAEIADVRRKTEGLADPLTAQVSPAVTELENKFRLLARAGIRLSVDEVLRLRQGIQSVNDVLASRQNIADSFSRGFGGAGSFGLALGVDQKSLSAIGTQIEFVQGKLSGLSAEVRGPAIGALEAYRAKALELFSSGALDTVEGRAQLDALKKKLVELTAVVTNVRPSRLAEQLKRIGDVARGVGANTGLALQQAAFAFEDFFSVQGGLDQRIRAAGNNISQLGFIIGGTSGLVAGIVVGIGAQLAAMYIKWANNGKTAADELKALNSVLERQESLASKLADSFGKVADAISQVGLSDAASRSLREQRDLLDEIRKQQDERRRASRADIDPAVQRERAFQAARRRELEAATDPGERVRLQIEVQRSQDRERRAAETAANRLAVDPSSVPGIITAGRVAVSEEEGRFEQRVNPSTSMNAARRAMEIQAAAISEGEAMSAAVAASQDQVGEARRLLRVEQRRLVDEINANEGFFGSWWQTPAQAERRRRLQQLEQTQSRLTYGDQVDSASRQAAESSLRSRGRLQIAFEAIDQAFAGGASQIATALQSLQEQLSAANDRLAEAQKGTDEQALARTKAARDEIVTLEDRINKERSAAQSVLAFSQALDRAGGNLVRQVAQESASAADEARRSANLENARANLGLVSRADADFARRQEDRARAAAAESAERQRQIEAEGRRLRNEFERGALPAEVRDAVTRRDEAQRQIDEARRIEGDPRSTDDQRRAATVQRRAAEEQLAAAQAQINAAFDQTDAAKRQREASNEADRRGQLQRLLDEQLKRGRDLIESPGARAARESAARIEDLVAARDEARKNGDLATAGRADRAIQREFRDVTGTPAERAAAETADAIERIRAVTRAAVAAGVPNARAQGAAAIQRTIEDRFRSTAPAIFALADAVQNSVLMGPSRAALTATDITTTDGARELTRLIRGDDPARDQNLVELRRQTQALQQVVQILRDQGIPIANN